VDTDILKPNTGYVSVERPSQVSSSKGSSEPPTTGVITPDNEQPTPYIEPVSEDEEEEVMDIGPARDEEKRTGLTSEEFAEAIAFREKILKERDATNWSNQEMKHKKDSKTVQDDESDVEGDERTPLSNTKSPSKVNTKPRTLSIDPLAPSSAFDQTLRERLRGAQKGEEGKYGFPGSTVDESIDENGQAEETGSTSAGPPGDDRILVQEWTAPAGKRIAVPVRIEPKVYFAAERTFLVSSCCLEAAMELTTVSLQKWLNTAVIIGTVATTLLNFIPPNDSTGLISAAFFTFSALLTVAYSGIVFVYRTYRLRDRSAEGFYYDKYGPTILCVALLLALGTNMGLRVSEMIDHA